jgi:hypothetical protein
VATMKRPSKRSIPSSSTNSRTFPDGRVYRGHEGVQEAFRIWLGTWEEYRQERDDWSTRATK